MFCFANKAFEIVKSPIKKSGDFIGGQDGYAHPNRLQGHQWIKEGDRFGGGMLVSEILAWSDPQIRKASDLESYAVPSELCQANKKYDLIKGALSGYGNGRDGVANLFDKLWHSESLESCPPLSEWKKEVDQVVDREGVREPALDGLSQLGADGRIRLQRKLVSVTEPVVGVQPPIGTTRIKVDLSKPKTQPSSGHASSPAPLPGFKPQTDWGKVIGWVLLAALLIVICIAILTAIGGYAVVSNASPPNIAVATIGVGPVVAAPSRTPLLKPTATKLQPTSKPATAPTQKPTKKPTNLPSSSSSKALTVCVFDTAPARKGPATSYTITEWVQKRSCIRFDGRYPSTFNWSSEVWLRIQDNQEGLYFLGHSWIRADNLSIRIDEIKSLPVINPE